MKFTQVEMTPEKAQRILDTHWDPEKQRRLSDITVERYARAMRTGNWTLTHEAIAIDDDDGLVDGQHRLLAVVRSGVAVDMNVAYGAVAIENVNRGRVRGLGPQLQLCDGVRNANMVASICRHIVVLAATDHRVETKVGALDVFTARAVLTSYGKEIAHVIEHRGHISGLTLSSMSGAVTFALRGGSESVRDFYAALISGEGLHKGDPALTLRNYLLANHTELIGYGGERKVRNATLTAAMHAELKSPWKAVKHTDGGRRFFSAKQRRTTRKLLRAVGYISKIGGKKDAAL